MNTITLALTAQHVAAVALQNAKFASDLASLEYIESGIDDAAEAIKVLKNATARVARAQAALEVAQTEYRAAFQIYLRS